MRAYILSGDDLRGAHRGHPRGTWRALISTVALSALSPSEALGLRWQRVDFDAGIIRVRSQLSRKGRLVPLQDRRVTLPWEFAPVATAVAAHDRRRGSGPVESLESRIAAFAGTSRDGSDGPRTRDLRRDRQFDGRKMNNDGCDIPLFIRVWAHAADHSRMAERSCSGTFAARRNAPRR